MFRYALAPSLFQYDGDTQLVAHAPDRFDCAFGDLTVRAFEFFAQSAHEFLQRVFAHGRRILGVAKEVA